MTLHSPLHDRHAAAGATFLDWGGWQLPARYSSVADEVRLVRNRAGYSECPFLSTIGVRGPDASSTLQRLCTRDLERVKVGQGVYSLMLATDGSIVDDGVIYRLVEDEFLVTLPGTKPSKLGNPRSFRLSRRPKPWLRAPEGSQVCIFEQSANMLSLQGPCSREILGTVTDVDGFRWFDAREIDLGVLPVLCSRSGFSGELGFELFTWPEYSVALWDLLAEIGEPRGAGPFGVQATMIMGLEKGYLNQNDAFPGSTPLELGLSWAVDLDKPDFVGREAVLARSEAGARARLVGIELDDSGPPPLLGDSIRSDGRQVGGITNAGFSPTFDRVLARGWLELEWSAAGTSIEVVCAGRGRQGRVASTYRWYDPQGLRVKG